MPALNAASTIQYALDSVIRDQRHLQEVIVVDDGSTDTTVDIVERYANIDKRIKVVSQNNVGVSAARNTGLRLATGKFVAFLDSDDFIFENSLTKRFEGLVYNDSKMVVGAFCPAVCLTVAGTRLFHFDHFSYKLCGHELYYYSSELGCPFNPSAALLKREKLELAGGFREDLGTAEDYELFQRLMRDGSCFIACQDARIAWVQSKKSLSKRNPEIHFNNSLFVLNLISDRSGRPQISEEIFQRLHSRRLTKLRLAAIISGVLNNNIELTESLIPAIQNSGFLYLSTDELTQTIVYKLAMELCIPLEDLIAKKPDLRQGCLTIINSLSRNRAEKGEIMVHLGKLRSEMELME
jgi:glycosyltransferase involved in cell wall biosynthesis